MIDVLGHFQSFCNHETFVKLNLPIFVVLVRQVDQATDGGIVKVGGTLSVKVVLVNFGALIPNMVVIPKGVAAFSLYFSFKPCFR